LTIWLAIVALSTLSLLLATLRRVPEGQAWTVHRFGRYVRTLEPGRHAVWPLVDRIALHVPLTGHHIAVPTPFGEASGSADLYYQILDPMPTGDGLESVDEIVMRQAGDAVHSVAEQMAPQPAAPASFADALKAELNRRLGSQGLRVIRCALHAS